MKIREIKRYPNFILSSQAAIHPVLTSINIPIADARRHPGKWYVLPASVVDALVKLVEAAEPLRGEAKIPSDKPSDDWIKKLNKHMGNITEAFSALDDAQED